MKDNCKVVLEGVEYESADFVAVLAKENGDASIIYNTDTLTLGMAVKMITREFVMCMNACSKEDQIEISALLGDAFMKEGADDDLPG
jgi:hypothetical protein